MWKYLLLSAKTYPCFYRVPRYHCGSHVFLHRQMLAHFKVVVCIIPVGRFWVRKLGHYSNLVMATYARVSTMGHFLLGVVVWYLTT